MYKKLIRHRDTLQIPRDLIPRSRPGENGPDRLMSLPLHSYFLPFSSLFFPFTYSFLDFNGGCGGSLILEIGITRVNFFFFGSRDHVGTFSKSSGRKFLTDVYMNLYIYTLYINDFKKLFYITNLHRYRGRQKR